MSVDSVLRMSGRKITTLSPHASVAEAAELLMRRDTQIVAISDSKGRILGVVTDSDILRDLVRCRGSAQVCAPNVTELMSRDIVTCRRKDNVERVLQMMKERGLRRIPVLEDDGALAGLVTMRDALLFLYEQAKLDEGSLREYIFGIGYH